jgi:hypothetical protein
VVDLLLVHDPLDVAHVVAPALLHALEAGHDPSRPVLLLLLPRLSQRGWLAFRRFKDTVGADEHWWSVWLTFSSERQLARARWWLAEEGFRPTIPGGSER